MARTLLDKTEAARFGPWTVSRGTGVSAEWFPTGRSGVPVTVWLVERPGREPKAFPTRKQAMTYATEALRA